MPNWCRNSLTITCKRKKETLEYIKKFINATSNGEMNEFVVPYKDMGIEEWEYDTCIEGWGTKWDINLSHLDHNLDLEDSSIIVNASYDTAWAPNIPVLEKLYEDLSKLDDRTDVTCTYEESGMDFCGKFSNGNDETWSITVLHHLLEESYDELDMIKTKDDAKLLLSDDRFFIIKERKLCKEWSPIHDESDEYEELSCFSNYYNFGNGDVTVYKWHDEYFIR